MYVYDDFGLLRFVIPPKAIDKIGSDTQISQSISDSLVFSYKYDERHRMIEKKIPGADSIYMIYDKRDRLVASQDGIRRNNNEWFFTKYDALNRPILTGIWEDTQSLTQDSLQSVVDTITGQYLYEESGSTVHDYTNRAFPDESDADNYLTVTYYDNYSFIDDSTYYFVTSPDSFPNLTEESTYTKSLITGSKTKVLTDDTWLLSVMYYDDYGRVIQTVSDNHFGGIERLLNKYDFVGKVLKIRHAHFSDASGTDSLVIWKDYAYDHAGRLLKEYEEIEGDTGNGRILLTKNEYNELGELIEKNLHATNSQETNFLQEIDYSYNIRGWLKKINDPTNISTSGDLFGLELLYDTINDLTTLTAEEQFNGNISAIKWTGAHYTTQSAYGFSYDKLNRLTDADYGEKSGGSWTDATKFNVYNLTYDKNGNIESLNRDGNSDQIDSLYYQYKGNQLQLVDDHASGTESEGFDDGTNQGDDYSYDDNGNLTLDENKDIDAIVYNELNLPEQIIFGDDTIFYVYDASGVKLKKMVSENGTVTEEIDYIGELVYKNDTLDFILTSEGRILDLGSNSYQYEYFLKDHLGNTRITFWDSSSVAAINQEFWYYPFGMTIKKFESSTDNKYLYNGKEFQEDLGLDWYDYGSRFYDPAVCRWFVMDPAVEDNHFDYSPYAYVYNNPMLFIDPFGLDSIIGMKRENNSILITNGPTDPEKDDYTNTIVLGENVEQEHVSDYSAEIVNDAMIAVSDNEVTVSSGKRTAEDQARIMYDNLEEHGVDQQKELYGSYGDQVIDVYAKARFKTDKQGYNIYGKNSIKSMMLKKINSIGSGKVSKHCIDDSKLNVFDIDPASVTNVSSFQNKLKNDQRVSKVIPYPKDPGIHIEIKLK